MPRRRRTEDVNTDSYLYEKQELRPTLDRFADDTSMLGFRYLHTRYKTWFRFVWALVLIFFVGLTVYQVCERIAYYFIRASTIVDKNPDLLRAMCTAYGDDGQITGNQTVIDSFINFNESDFLEINRLAHQTLEDLLVSCDLGKLGSCQDYVKPIYTADGLCLAVSPNVTVRRPGPETTLSLLLNLEVYEIIPGMVIDPGVTLSIYDEGQRMADYGQGIHLEAGKVVTIPINEVRNLTRYHQYCGRRDVGPFGKEEYSLAACKWTYLSERVEEKCGCTPILSPYYRHYMSGEAKKNNTRKTRKRRAACNVFDEISCVSKLMENEGDVNVGQHCPEDCSEVSYSSVVFGDSLVPSEIISMLPSDWEDQKEKRMAEYQKALDVIPNERIPVVQAVQSLANEVQQFIFLANQIYENGENGTSIPCFATNGQRSTDMNKFRPSESIWERATTYFTRSLSRELNSTAKAIGLIMHEDGTLENRQELFVSNYSLIALSLLQLGSTEARLSSPSYTFGLKQMDQESRKAVIAFVLPFIKEMKQCVMKLHERQEEQNEKSAECQKLFRDHYEVLLDAQRVYNMANHNSPSFLAYEELTKKIKQALSSVSMLNRVKALDWHNHDISIKLFENLYREGGKDNIEITELMKLRKPMVSDIVETVAALIQELNESLASRSRFLEKLQIVENENSTSIIHETIACLQDVTERIPQLKKSSFLRGEWLSRVQRQVQIAQSYSPSPEYDQVNLLHVKLYFAHFKQETIIQERSYNMFLLLAEIGGTIGLYVGATLLTVAETIVFFFEKRTRITFMKPAHI